MLASSSSQLRSSNSASSPDGKGTKLASPGSPTPNLGDAYPSLDLFTTPANPLKRDLPEDWSPPEDLRDAPLPPSYSAADQLFRSPTGQPLSPTGPNSPLPPLPDDFGFANETPGSPGFNSLGQDGFFSNDSPDSLAGTSSQVAFDPGFLPLPPLPDLPSPSGLS